MQYFRNERSLNDWNKKREDYLELGIKDIYIFSFKEFNKEHVGAIANVQLIKVYDIDNTFRPQVPIKRAESVVLLNNAVNNTVLLDLTINRAGTVIENQILNNIYITNKVGKGEVVLKNVTVKGELLVEGGGENSIKIEDSQINKLTTNKTN